MYSRSLVFKLERKTDVSKRKKLSIVYVILMLLCQEAVSMDDDDGGALSKNSVKRIFSSGSRLPRRDPFYWYIGAPGDHKQMLETFYINVEAVVHELSTSQNILNNIRFHVDSEVLLPIPEPTDERDRDLIPAKKRVKETQRRIKDFLYKREEEKRTQAVLVALEQQKQYQREQEESQRQEAQKKKEQRIKQEEKEQEEKIREKEKAARDSSLEQRIMQLEKENEELRKKMLSLSVQNSSSSALPTQTILEDQVAGYCISALLKRDPQIFFPWTLTKNISALMESEISSLPKNVLVEGGKSLLSHVEEELEKGLDADISREGKDSFKKMVSTIAVIQGSFWTGSDGKAISTVPALIQKLNEGNIGKEWITGWNDLVADYKKYIAATVLYRLSNNALPKEYKDIEPYLR